MICLLRHGEIAGAGSRRFIGQTDIPLGENGRRQAECWGEAWAGRIWDRVYASDLVRSLETAQIIVGSRHPVLALPGLREIAMGEWDGQPMAEIRARYPEAWELRGRSFDTFRPPGGESFADLRDRVLPVFNRIAGKARGPVLIVAHAGVNRVILCGLLGVPLCRLFEVKQDYGCLNRIDCGSGGLRVSAVNAICGQDGIPC